MMEPITIEPTLKVVNLQPTKSKLKKALSQLIYYPDQQQSLKSFINLPPPLRSPVSK